MNDGTPEGFSLVLPHTGQAIELSPDGATIGRHPDNTIAIPDPQVSRHHARISWQAGAYVIEDLDSGNGTFINGQRISGPRLLRPGNTIRLGSTSLQVRGPSPDASEGRQPRELPASAHQPPPSRKPRRLTTPVYAGFLIGAFLIVCLVAAAVFWLLDRRNVSPAVSIQAPANGSVYTAGSTVRLIASATGVRDINRLDVFVDGRLAAQATSADPGGEPSIIAEGSWTAAETGTHIVAAVAYTARNRASDTVTAELRIVESVAEATPVATASSTPQATASATAPSSPAATSATSTATPTSTSTEVISPTTTPTATQSPTATPTATEIAPPKIEYFWITPDTVAVGDCAVLEWGAVSGAETARIEPDIGGVGAPGSRQVCPPASTVYTLTAVGPGGIVSATAAITVTADLPDLVVESVTFVPDPPVRGQGNEVRIRFRNAGTGDSGPFYWSWTPGADSPYTGSQDGGLVAAGTVTVTLTWQPEVAHSSLPTVARADTANAVVESDETNNEMQVSVEVVEPAEVTVVLTSEPQRDGYVPSLGDAVTGEEIRVGSGDPPPDEWSYRGFMSFDLSAIPAGASIVSAYLRFYQVGIEGDPYGHLGSLVLEHVDCGPQLDSLDYSTLALDSLGLAAQNTPLVWYEAGADTITGWVIADLEALRTRFQARLQFSNSLDPDLVPDYLSIESGDDSLGTGNRPQLVVAFAP